MRLFFSANSICGRFCSMNLLGFGDGPVHAAQQLIAGRTVQAGRFDVLPRLFQHGQRALGIGFAHGRALASLCAKSAATCRASTCCRAAVSSASDGGCPGWGGCGGPCKAFVRDGTDNNCKWSCNRWAVTGSNSFIRAAAWRNNS